MKSLDLNSLENINGGTSRLNAFLSGVACGYGLATAATGVGVAIAIVGCSTFFLP